jgi:hypothetical protein
MKEITVKKQVFKLSAVLSIAGDKLMGDMDDVYTILNFMSGDTLFTHQLPRVAMECRPYLLKQHPWLKEYIKKYEPKVTSESYKEILNECESKWGKEIIISTIPKRSHVVKNPIQELDDLVK